MAGAIVDGGSGVNVINKTTCDRLGIRKWDACPFWLRMADTSTVRPLDLIRHLDVIIGGYTFQISVVVLQLDSVGAYPLLLGRPWLKTANIKQNWNKNVLAFRKGKSKLRVSTKENITTSRQCLPIHAEVVNMMEGLDETEEKHYFNENPKIIPLFEVDIVQALTPYVEDHPDTILVDEQTLKEIRLQQEACEKEMLVYQRVQASSLEELNLAEDDLESQPKAIIIAKEMRYEEDKQKPKDLLKQYKDVFSWSFEDMKGLDPAFY